MNEVSSGCFPSSRQSVVEESMRAELEPLPTTGEILLRIAGGVTAVGLLVLAAGLLIVALANGKSSYAGLYFLGALAALFGSAACLCFAFRELID